MKKTILMLLVILLAVSALGGCARYSEEPTDKEVEALRRALAGERGPAELAETYVIYNRHDKPAYVLGVLGDSYAIIKRGGKLCEMGEKNPYAEYMNLKKYYGEILLYIVYDPSNAEAPFYNIAWDTCGATYAEAAKKR